MKSKKTNFFKFNISIFLIATLLYLFNEFILKKNTTGFVYYFFICYFNDILAPLLLLPYSNILLEKEQKQIVSLRNILVFMCVCGFVWEYLAPFMKPSSTTDIIDLIAYLFGGFLYWLCYMKLSKRF